MTRSSVSSNQEGNDSKTIGVADEHIGAVVGRGGRTITEISQVGSYVLNSNTMICCYLFFDKKRCK